ncbi:hypothetical protein DUNSADRAFT_4535 [Dunaliella salina]|uniref:Encoded protein n=1 Tax=Dunaliella salina TaxID=3046 RepID=A0ABQ7GRT9_DUNSA|nr:hypothetical protein DUNSADRAFT_4535 [Dunaliella salina]|eukprot:KAF5837327.1 hypothetical protein DUNSADRAFT_4535 [Dunaliella salina]
MGSTSSEWVWQVLDRVGAEAALTDGQGRPSSDAAVLGNLLERIKAQTTRLGNKSQPGTMHNAIIRVPSPRTLWHPSKPKPPRRSLSCKSSPPGATGALGNTATAPGHVLDPGTTQCAVDHGSAASTGFVQRPTLAASSALASAPMAAPAETAHAKIAGANMAAGRHCKVPPVSVSTSARPSSVKHGLRPQLISAQTPRLNIELHPPPSPLPSPHVSDQARRSSFSGTFPHAAASPRASSIADSRIHAPSSTAQTTDARLLHSNSSVCTSHTSCAPRHAQSSLAHHPGRTGRPLRERFQLSVKIPQGSVAASHSSQQSSPATPQDESKRPPQERVVNQVSVYNDD